MAAGAVQASISGLKTRDHGLSFVKSVDFVKVTCLPSQRIKSQRENISVIRNSNQGPETIELQPTSEGSPLLGILSLFFEYPVFIYIHICVNYIPATAAE